MSIGESKGTRLWIVAAGAIVVALALLVIMSVRGSDDTPQANPAGSQPDPVMSEGALDAEATNPPETADPSAPATPTEASNPPPQLDPAEAERKARRALRGFLRTSQAALAEPDSPLKPVRKFARAGAYGEVEAQTSEFQDLGVRINGASAVISTDVESVDVRAGPPAVVISLCLDDSSVEVISPEYPDGVTSEKKTKNTYVVTYVRGVWKVSDHSFPNDPDCS